MVRAALQLLLFLLMSSTSTFPLERHGKHNYNRFSFFFALNRINFLLLSHRFLPKATNTKEEYLSIAEEDE